MTGDPVEDDLPMRTAHRKTLCHYWRRNPGTGQRRTVTGCCGRSVFHLASGDTTTSDPTLVTCPDFTQPDVKP